DLGKIVSRLTVDGAEFPTDEQRGAIERESPDYDGWGTGDREVPGRCRARQRVERDDPASRRAVDAAEPAPGDQHISSQQQGRDAAVWGRVPIVDVAVGADVGKTRAADTTHGGEAPTNEPSAATIGDDRRDRAHDLWERRHGLARQCIHRDAAPGTRPNRVEG